MSGFNTPLGGAAPAQPKQISNRLLNMKFMQRAAATTAQKSPHQVSTPPGEPQPKRRRTGEFATGLSNPSTPTSASTPSYSYANRTGLLEANTTPTTRGTNTYSLDGIETEWVLNVQILPVNGHAATNGTRPDSEDEGEYDESGSEDDIWGPNAPSGRQAYGSFKRKKTKTASANATPASENKYERKHGREDVDNEDEISGISDDESDSEEGEASDHVEVASATKRKAKRGGVDFKSETALRKMDSLDFQRPGFDHGFGRQRPGLMGDGRGFGSPAHGRAKSKKKARKSR